MPLEKSSASGGLQCDPSITCIICLDDESDAAPTNLMCGHTFHENCIASWSLVSPRCPLCKARLDRLVTNQAHSGFAVATTQGARQDTRWRRNILRGDLRLPHRRIADPLSFRRAVYAAELWAERCLCDDERRAPKDQTAVTAWLYRELRAIMGIDTAYIIALDLAVEILSTSFYGIVAAGLGSSDCGPYQVAAESVHVPLVRASAAAHLNAPQGSVRLRRKRARDSIVVSDVGVPPTSVSMPCSGTTCAACLSVSAFVRVCTPATRVFMVVAASVLPLPQARIAHLLHELLVFAASPWEAATHDSLIRYVWGPPGREPLPRRRDAAVVHGALG